MKIISTLLKDCWILKNKKIKDSRGYFQENFHQKKFEKITGQKIFFIQTNFIFSKKGSLRGLHLQRPPYTQSKLISVFSGKILDVVVDVRLNSPTYGKHIKEKLSNKNQKQIFLSKGFAHGFITLTKKAKILYQCTSYYSKKSEDGIKYDDPLLNINWEYPIKKIILSKKDKKQKYFKDFIPFSL